MFSYVTRAQWSARSPSRTINKATCSQRDQFITHYSAGPPNQTVRAIQNFHMDTNDWPDIGYNWLVDRNGTIYEGRLYNYDAIGTHAANNNTRSVGCCFIGGNADVTDAAKAAIRMVYDEACRRCNKSLRMLGHRDVNSTSCPGDNLWTWVHAGMPSDGGLFMSLTGEQEQDIALAAYRILSGDAAARSDDRWNPNKVNKLLTQVNETHGAVGSGGFTQEMLNEAVAAALENVDFTAAVVAALNSPEGQEAIVRAQNTAEDT